MEPMKICFVCPGLEPGKDAVGDYTLQIARRLLAQGWSVTIIALADRYVDASTGGERDGCRTLRFPKASSWTTRWAQLEEAVGECQPDWISLQWVAFGYQDKGLPLSFGARLRQIAGAIPLHVMCHEIWVCADGAGSLKSRLYSCLQREVHRRCFKALAPACLHTHALPYAQALKRIGQPAKILPLGSNVHAQSGDVVYGASSELGSASNGDLIFIVFGNTPPEWNATFAVQMLGQECQRLGRQGILYFAGKGGPEGSALAELVAHGEQTGIRVENLGFLERERILAYMDSAHAGLATVPFALWQKSSAVAAMRTSGLPVLFNRFDGAWPKDWLPTWEAGFFRLEAGVMEQVIEAKADSGPDLWEAAMRQFLADLESDHNSAAVNRV